ncbi:MAG: hypothetical protein AAFY88_04030, partial [Acidobacteriota bacterium]
MDALQVSRHAEIQGKTVRRLLRRGGRARITKVLAKMRVEDVAIMLRGFTPAEQYDVFKLMMVDFRDQAGSVLLELDPQSRRGLLEQLKPDTVAELLATVNSDDAVFILDSLPEEQRDQVLAI